MIFKTLEIDNIYRTIKRASKWQHNSYHWNEEWDWIEKELQKAEDLILRQQEKIQDLEMENIEYQERFDELFNSLPSID